MVVRVTLLLLTEVVIQPHKGGFCFLITDSSCGKNYFYLFLVLLVSYAHTPIKKPTLPIKLHWRNVYFSPPMFIFSPVSEKSA